MRAAVVGGGIFGCTAAIELARAGVQVDLFERRHDVLLGASRCNQGRLHAGYHYPRSLATAHEVRDAAPQFAARFPTTISTSARHHYVVAKGGLTSAGKYAAFLDELGLPYQEVAHPLVRRDTTDLQVRADESFVNLAELRTVLRRELREANVGLCYGNPNAWGWGYDTVVDATYGQFGTQRLQFELCEIALIRLGAHFAGLSFVVMDGPYMSLDPLVGTDLHMLYDVAHSVHHVSDRPDDYPPAYTQLVDHGLKRTDLSRVDLMQGTARQFLSGVGMPEYHGSRFTVRAVLPDMDATDARPTLVEQDGKLITVLSGKIVTAVAAARQVVDLAVAG